MTYKFFSRIRRKNIIDEKGKYYEYYLRVPFYMAHGEGGAEGHIAFVRLDFQDPAGEEDLTSHD